MLKTIFAQETAEAAHEQWAAVADALRERFPKLAELMDGAREDVLAYMRLPREHWPQIASTNPLERLNGEIKRRADVVGSPAEAVKWIVVQFRCWSRAAERATRSIGVGCGI